MDINTKQRQEYIKSLQGIQSNEEKAKMWVFGALAFIILLAISN